MDPTLSHVHKYSTASSASDNASCGEVTDRKNSAPSSSTYDDIGAPSVKCLKTTKFPNMENLTVFPLVSLNIVEKKYMLLLIFAVKYL